MKPIQKIRNVLRGLKQGWGTSLMKRSLWNKEFAEGRWQFIENTADDPVYAYLEKYCAGGRLLDLGCGYGNTGCELEAGTYSAYTGVDISDFAIDEARIRAAERNREAKNEFFQADIATYIPRGTYDVILFRESIYYIPRARIKALLDRYSAHLTERGVFIVRCHNNAEGAAVLRLLGKEYSILDQHCRPNSEPHIAVFRRVQEPVATQVQKSGGVIQQNTQKGL